MNICVVGWYLYDDLYAKLKIVNKKYPVCIISHKSSDKLIGFGLSYREIPNVGLEFGAYDYYLKNLWDKESDVLFMHDDARIEDETVFDRIADLKDLGIDQAYLFKNEAENVNNGGKHGRAIYISKKLLTFMLQYECECHQSIDHCDTHNPDTMLVGTGKHTGFWFDPNNKGHVSGKPPKGVRHYNDMIYHFHWYLGRIRDCKFGNEKMNILHRLYFPELDCGRRGAFREERIGKK